MRVNPFMRYHLSVPSVEKQKGQYHRLSSQIDDYVAQT